jgi:hypothetical protein
MFDVNIKVEDYLPIILQLYQNKLWLAFWELKR